MCCYPSSKSKQEILDLFEEAKKSGKKYIILYKLLIKKRFEKDFLSGPFYSHNNYRSGWLLSSSRAKNKLGKNAYNKLTTGLQRGIHVYRNVDWGNVEYQWQKKLGHKPIFVQIRCYLKDFIGADYETAVFTKVELTRDEYLRVCKEINMKPLPHKKGPHKI